MNYNKIPFKESFINSETGEFKTVKYTARYIKYPIRGAIKMYTNKALVALAGLSQSDAKLLEEMINHRDKYNIVRKKLIELVKITKLNWKKSYTSRRISLMKELNLIQKYKGKIWINPYIIQPKYNEDDPESGLKTQIMWKRSWEDKDAYYDGIDEEMKILFNQKEIR